MIFTVMKNEIESRKQTKNVSGAVQMKDRSLNKLMWLFLAEEGLCLCYYSLPELTDTRSVLSQILGFIASSLNKYMTLQC